MKNLRLLLLGILVLLGSAAQAQDLKVKAFQRMDRDLLARTQERLDLNDVPCAIVRVSVPDAKDYTFEGNVIGDVIYKPGEAIVYMTQGSRNITIKSDKFGSLKYEFTQKLEKQVVYKLALQFDEAGTNKVRTLVMPVVGVGSTLSYGIMIGVVKKAGAYAKVKANFKNQETSLECTEAGTSPEGTPMWFTGNTQGSRLAVTGGLLVRAAKVFYTYGGLGYGYKKLAWESVGDEWAENTDKSYDGLEAELGGIVRLKNFAMSLGVQTNSFKYFEATVGIGIMF